MVASARTTMCDFSVHQVPLVKQQLSHGRLPHAMNYTVKKEMDQCMRFENDVGYRIELSAILSLLQFKHIGQTGVSGVLVQPLPVMMRASKCADGNA